MPDTINLSGDIAGAIDGALLRGSPVAVAYTREDGSPTVSFRGSTQVLSATELAVWARKRDSGLAAAIAHQPRVALVFFEMQSEGIKFLSIEGRARVAPEVSDRVWEAMVAPEQEHDAERGGVAIVIDVDTVTGMGAGGLFQQAAA
jgi:hypothetical protein